MATIAEKIMQMPLKSKLTLAAVVLTAVSGVVLLVSWSQRPDYRVLYSNLPDSDAGAIVQKLKDLKVPYRAEGGSLLVPADKVYDLRLQLASEGMPRGGGIGFELFDKTDFGVTDFVQKLNYQRALQGELARTIMSLQEVEQCRVHLATPEKSILSTDESKPSASIFLKLRGGRVLSQGQVQGIVHLVSSSIEGLNPKDVTIIDSYGNLLTQNADGSMGLSASQVEYRKNLEKDIEARVVGILDPVVGRGKVKAKASLDIDFTNIEKTEEKYDPDSQVARSEQRNVEKTTNMRSGGVPGVASNIPGKTATSAADMQGQSQKQNDTVNYEISKVVSHIVNATGEVKRLSVAVIVDGTYAATEGSKEKKYVARSEEDIKRYEDLVRKAVGFNADRGDQVQVMNMQFEGVAGEELQPMPKQYLPAVMSVLRLLVPVAAFILVLLFVIRPLLRTLSAPSLMQSQPALPLPQTVAELERAMATRGLEGGTNPMREEVIEWARKNPDKAASLVSGWIEER